jgi:hypothetical protein
MVLAQKLRRRKSKMDHPLQKIYVCKFLEYQIEWPLTQDDLYQQLGNSSRRFILGCVIWQLCCERFPKKRRGFRYDR